MRLFYFLLLFLGGIAWAVPPSGGGSVSLSCEPGITIDFSSGAPKCTGGYELTKFNWNTGEGACIKRQGDGSPVVTNACNIISQQYRESLQNTMKQASDNTKPTAKVLPVSLTGNVPVPPKPAPQNLTNLLLSAVLIDGNFQKSVDQLGSLSIGGTSFKALTPTFKLYGGFFSDAQPYVRSAVTIMMAFASGWLFYAMSIFGASNGKEAVTGKLKSIGPALGLSLFFMFTPISSHSTGGGSTQETALQMLINKYITDSVNNAYELSVKLNNRYFQYLAERSTLTLDDSGLKNFAAKEAVFGAEAAWITAAKNVCDTQVNCGNLNRYSSNNPYSCEFCANVNKAMVGIEYMNKVLPWQKQAAENAYNAQVAAHTNTLSKISTVNNQLAQNLGLLQVAYMPSMNIFIENSIANFKSDDTKLNVSGIQTTATDEANFQNKVNLEDAYLAATADTSFWGKISSLWNGGGESTSNPPMPSTISRMAESSTVSQVVGDEQYLKPFATVAAASPYMILPGSGSIYSISSTAVGMIPDVAMPWVFEKVMFGSIARGQDLSNRGIGGQAETYLAYGAGALSGVATVLSVIPGADGVSKVAQKAANVVLDPMRLMTSLTLTGIFLKAEVEYLPVLALTVVATIGLIMFVFDVMLFKIASMFVPLFAFTMGDNGKVREFAAKGFSLMLWPFTLVFAVLLAIVFNTLIDVVFVGLIKQMVGSIYNLAYVMNTGDGNGIASKLGLIYFMGLSDVLGGVTKLFFGVYILLKTHGHITDLVGINSGGGMMSKATEYIQGKTSNLQTMRL